MNSIPGIKFMKSALRLFSIIVCLFMSVQSFAQVARPNVVIILLDDVRFDAFQPSGGPSYFITPSINSIAEEGANFKDFFCTYSLCVPGRGTISTGLYPHNNGAIGNYGKYYMSLPTIAKVLDSVGYHTAFIGKPDHDTSPQPGWDYWFVTNGPTQYVNGQYWYFNQFQTIAGHRTKIIGDTAEKYVAKLDTPFFIEVSHQVPHRPVEPQDQYKLSLAGNDFPVPDNWPRYTWKFPSFLYERPYFTDSQKVKNDYELMYEGLLGAEDNVRGILDSLEARGILKNTIVILMGDNGAQYGEHQLSGKGLPSEASMRVPCYIRYPAFFNAGTLVTDQIGLNLDIFPTILDAVGIKTDYHLQGMSLKDLANGNAARDLFMYENIKIDVPNADDDTTITPSLRTIRSHNYKYNKYYCLHETEEFFDLVADPGENINQIDNPSYQLLIDQYKTKLDSMEFVLNDTLSADTILHDCHLVRGRRGVVIHHDGPNNLKLGSNPVEDALNFSFENESEEQATVSVQNLLGEILYRSSYAANTTYVADQIDVSPLPSGIYYINVRGGNSNMVRAFLKQ
ncbi:MAG: sulfatase-like hydrolase/transferase [Chitinophagales bacterium]|nr:sulfatase-like hydrolase/transferase [Chitinophagales bacterium]